MKTCSKCRVSQPLNDFYKASLGRENKASWCKVCHSKIMKQQRLSIRIKVLEAYNNKCACCGETRPEFLTVQHVNGDGATHRKQIGRSSTYTWLVKHNFPSEGFELNCWNCNCAKGLYGYCPHEVP